MKTLKKQLLTVLIVCGMVVMGMTSIVYKVSASEVVLSQEVQEKVMEVGDKITMLIEENKIASMQVEELLNTLKERYMQSQEEMKVAIIDALIAHIFPLKVAIANGCTAWYDGCNNCMIGENGELACTKMFCAEQQEPMCKAYQKTVIIADHTVDCVGVGPQQCMFMKENTDDEWKNMYASIEGFEYEAGYEYTLLVEETHLDPTTIPADASSIKWKLITILDIHAEIPETCTTWFDGCNTCVKGENDNYACTEKACLDTAQKPYCMDETN